MQLANDTDVLFTCLERFIICGKPFFILGIIQKGKICQHNLELPFKNQEGC